MFVGAVQGYFAGWTDIVMERFKEIWSSMPTLYMLIIFSSLFSASVGLLVILLALIVFAVEYEWARRRLVAVRARARSAADKAAASRVATASAVLFGIGAIGLGAVLIFTDLLPLSSVWTGASVALGGLTVLATTAYSVREMRRAQKADRAWGEAADRA